MDKKKRLKKLLDRDLQLWVRETYKTCLLDSTPVFCGHHFVNKSNSLALRWYKPNIIPICLRHHSLIHSQPSIPTAEIILIKGKPWLEDLKRERKREVRDTLKYYQSIKI